MLALGHFDHHLQVRLPGRIWGRVSLRAQEYLGPSEDKGARSPCHRAIAEDCLELQQNERTLRVYMLQGWEFHAGFELGINI